jgi:hypothetical protein
MENIGTELVCAIPLSIGVLAISLAAFSQKQKEWFRKRDANKNGVAECKYPVLWNDNTYTPCGRTDRLEVHHVTPQRWSKTVLKQTDDQIDTKDNGIDLCYQHHQTIVHPDMNKARADNNADKQSFYKVFNERQKKAEKQIAYWDTSHDSLFKRIVRALNKNYEEPYPKKYGRKT